MASRVARIVLQWCGFCQRNTEHVLQNGENRKCQDCIKRDFDSVPAKELEVKDPT